MRKPLWVGLVALLSLFGAACGGSDDSAPDAGGIGGGTSDSSDASDDGGAGDSASSTDQPDDGADGPDDDDAAEILGDPDLDLEDLPDEAADAIDAIDDVVSLGECQSEVIGLAITPPDGYVCRVLDVAIGGMDGFTLFTEGNELNVTIGTPSPIAPCEVLQACDSAEAIALSDEWPDTEIFEFAGTVTIWGSHATKDAEVIITKLSELTDDEFDLIMTVLDSTVEIG